MDMAPGPGALGLGPWAQAQEAYFPYILVQIGLFQGSQGLGQGPGSLGSEALFPLYPRSNRPILGPI